MILNGRVTSSGGTADNREQTISTISFIIIQIISSSNRCMYHHQESPNQHRHQHVQPHISENQGYNRNNSKNYKDETVIDLKSENDQRLVAEEVEEEPGDKDNQEDNHGNRMPQEAKEEYKEYDHSVIDTEVTEISFNTHGGFADGVGAGDGVEVKELRPGTTSGHHGVCCASEVAGGGASGRIYGSGRKGIVLSFELRRHFWLETLVLRFEVEFANHVK